MDVLVAYASGAWAAGVAEELAAVPI